jgi:hypothetical protein
VEVIQLWQELNPSEIDKDYQDHAATKGFQRAGADMPRHREGVIAFSPNH